MSEEGEFNPFRDRIIQRMEARGLIFHPLEYYGFISMARSATIKQKASNMVKRLKRKRERSLWGFCKRYGLPSLLLNPTHRNT